MYMAKSKIEKARTEALAELLKVKSKLNIRTYDAYRRNVYKSRIDKVKRITEEIKDIKEITGKKLVKNTIKSALPHVKVRKAVNNVILSSGILGLDSGNYQKIVQEVLKYVGKNIIISYVDNGVVITTFDMRPTPGNVREKIFYALFYEPNDYLDQFPNGKLIIQVESNEKFTPQKIAQAFKQGITNCLFKPMIDWAENKLINSKSESTTLKYKSKLNVMKKLEKQYHESGVDENKIQEIANKLQVDIHICQPFQKKFIEKKSEKKALTKFNFINSKLNHIDLNEVVNKEPVYVTYEDLVKLYDQLIKSDDYFTYTRGHIGYTSISTLENTYRLNNDYQEFTKEFEKDNFINECYLDDYKDIEISKYVRNACHFNHTIDFKELRGDDDEFIFKDYKHIDMKGAYKNCNSCKWYEGYLGKIGRAHV